MFAIFPLVARFFHLDFAIFVPGVRHFRFDLAISDLLIFGPISRHFRFDLAIFAQIADHVILSLTNLCGRSSSFSPRPYEC